MNNIFVSQQFKKVYVILELNPVEKKDRRFYDVDSLQFPRRLFMAIDYDLELDKDFFAHETSINFVLAKNLEEIAGAVMQEADKQGIMRPDAVQIIIHRITSVKEETQGLAEWKTVYLI